MTSYKRLWVHDLLLIVVLAAASWFRVIGMNWDADQHLHPDERFLTMVETALQVRRCALPQVSMELCPADQVRWIGLGEYLDTGSSPLNPHNRGYGFFVYGDFPIVLVRYVAEWLGQTGYDQVHLVGRQVSALSDLLTIVLIYVIAARLYDRRVALLAAAFSSLAVLQIQQSHFFTVDTVANLFIFLSLLFAAEITRRGPPAAILQDEAGLTASMDDDEGRLAALYAEDSWRGRLIILWSGLKELARNPLAVLSLGFGVSLGLAMASKLNAAPLAIVLPAAFAARYFMFDRDRLNAQGAPAITAYWSRILTYLVVGGLFTMFAFRLAQPYAFDGLGLNPAWLANIRDLQAQSSGDMDVPFALQWARRSPFFSVKNLTVWGLGLPLGILAWVGFAAMGVRLFKGELRHALLWGWTAIYFVWQSLAFNPTMRYQLPVYPLLCMMAAWFLVFLWDQRRRYHRRLAVLLFPLASFMLGLLVLTLTAAWAYAFTRIYTRPVTRVAATRWIYQNVPGPLNLRIQGEDGSEYQQPLSFGGGLISEDSPYVHLFAANASGTVHEIYLPHAAALAGSGSQTLRLSLALQPEGAVPSQPIAFASLTSEFAAQGDPRGQGFTLRLDRPAELIKGQLYYVQIATDGVLKLSGAAPINESDWDDGLPLRFGAEGYDAYGGMYEGDLNLQLYWDDDIEKLTRLTDTLGRGDYIFMSSNRQWATIPRVPERYPLTTTYYRALIGCPDDRDVIWCYNVARPGMFEGQLGYELAEVFESFPTLDIPGVLRWEINDQFAEEAFTVYDHPKVLIFRKTEDYSAERVRGILGAVDLQSVVYLTPRQAASYKSLILTPVAWARQQAGGTWSELFDYDWIQNRIQVVGLLLWYAFIFVLGLFTYPILRAALPGLGDKGYPAARTLGLVLLACAAWLAGSAGIPVTRPTVALVFALMVAVGTVMGWGQRAELAQEWRSQRRYFLLVEGLFLAFFVFDLLIRLGNPDLWHPAKGGERPMDFSYFNAIIKSTTFPPYDPWFAGGYINYYYYGFVLVAMPVKLLGIVPSLAYNFILPTLFAVVALGAFCVGWNLLDARRSPSADEGDAPPPSSFVDSRLVAGVLSASLMVALGNLGSLRMIYRGLQQMAAPGGVIDPANIFQRMVWLAEGVARAIGGQMLPLARGDWYWNPSRVIPPGPGNEITEFPLFTFLYSDLHAHMLAMPLALLALVWALGVVRSRRITFLTLLVGGVAIGALYPTNLSDIYTYLPIGFAALAYGIWRSDAGRGWRLDVPHWLRKLILIAVSVGALTVLAYGIYQPYRQAYSQGYSALEAWTGPHTPIWSYLTHWGVFLFILSFWLGWETRQWMAETPARSLYKLRPYQILIEAGIAAFLVALLYLAYRGVQIGWIALPLSAWAAVLMLRPGLPDAKRFVLFLVGTALLINIVVETVVVRGDIGRMNTVFKFYLQGWALLSVSAAAAFAWLLPELRRWLPGWRNVYQAGASALLAGAALFTVSAATDKIADRMAGGVSITLDSIAYMQHAQYADFDLLMHLDQDYRAIRWMQDNVQGSPVIVEANCPEYHWCTRFTIYTGLPGVVGWNWHQRQQRTLTPMLVEERVSEIASFYRTLDEQEVVDFLQRYNVRYIIVGQLERAAYAGEGLEKFAAYDGKLWDIVYREGETAIYRVLP